MMRRTIEEIRTEDARWKPGGTQFDVDALKLAALAEGALVGGLPDEGDASWAEAASGLPEALSATGAPTLAPSMLNCTVPA